MNPVGDPKGEAATLRDRLSRLSEASLQISENLEFDAVLQGILDSVCSLTDARYGMVVILDDSGGIEDILSYGMTAEEYRQFRKLSDGTRFFEFLNGLSAPLRLDDFHGHIRTLGLPELRAPAPVGSVSSFLASPVRHRGQRTGSIYAGGKEGDGEFTPEDLDTLVMFASQAALVIADAHRHREEHRARVDLEALVDTSPVGVMVFDAKTGSVVSVNREAIRIVGGPREAGRPVEELLAGLTFRQADSREVSLKDLPLLQTLKTGETVRAEEVVIQAPDGNPVATLVNATPTPSEEGQLESVVVTLQDLTPMHNLERMRTEFLSLVMDELRTPLISIKGSATTLLESASVLDPTEILQFHRIINDQADHMRDQINDLLDVARIETGTLSVDPEAVNLAGLMEEARSAFLSRWGRNNISFDWPANLPRVMADRRRIVRVLGNLLYNAARYSHKSTTIRVSAVREEFHVAVSVTDEGQGITATALPHLFQRPQSINGEDWGRDVGESGLSLAVCRGIVEAHGGRIWAESAGPEMGTRFTFTLPVADERVAPAPTGSPGLALAPQDAQQEPAHVLVVGDDPQMLRYVRDSLTRAGCTLVVASSPQEIPHLIESDNPHLVLLDLTLPDDDGIEVMRDILREVDVPVILLTNYGQDHAIARAFEMGAADYVVKPFSPTELAARVNAALRRRTGPQPGTLSGVYVLGDLTVNYTERRVTVAGRQVRLTATEYNVLEELSRNAGMVLSHTQLLQRVWGKRNVGDAARLRTVVKNIRNKLGDDATNPVYIFTESRVGYRMERPVPTVQATP